MYTLTKVNVVHPRSVSTARTSIVTHPIGDGVVDEDDKSSTANPWSGNRA